MFGFMKKAQIMVHLLIFNVMIPGNAQLFFSGLLGFLTFNIINLSEHIRNVFHLHQDQSVNDNFFNLGYSSTYFVVNMGNLYLIMLYIGIKLLLSAATSRVTIKNEKVAKVRGWLEKDLYWSQVLQFVTESYIILCVSCIANFTNMTWSHAGHVINSIFSILSMAAIIFYTAFSYLKVKQNRSRLKLKVFKDKYGYLYEGLRINRGLHELKEPMLQGFRVIVLISALLLL